MPINTDPEALDAFDSLDDNDKSSLIDEMSDEDAHSLTEAMTSHRAARQAARGDSGTSSLIEDMSYDYVLSQADATTKHKQPRGSAQMGAPEIINRIPDAGVQVGAPQITNRVPDAGMQVGEPVINQVKPQPQESGGLWGGVKNFAADAQARATQAGSPFEWRGGIVGAVDSAKAAFVDPPVRAIQENVFRPAVNTLLAGEKQMGLPDMPPVELARRAAVKWLAGEGVMDDMPEAAKLKAVNDLEAVYRHPIMQSPLFDKVTKMLPDAVQEYLPNTPEKKAAYSLSVADQIGQIPLMFIGGGKVASMAAKAGTIAGRIAGSMASGALAMSTVSLVTPGQKPSEAALTGALVAGAPVAAGEAWGAVGRALRPPPSTKGQAPQVLGVGLSGWADDVVRDLSGPIAEKKVVGKLVNPPEVTPAQKADIVKFADQASSDMKAAVTPPPQFQPAKLNDPNFKPGMSFVTVDPSGGMKGRLAQVKDGQAFIYERPINTIEDAVNFMAEVKSKGAGSPLKDSRLKDWNAFTDEMAAAFEFKSEPVKAKGSKVEPRPKTAKLEEGTAKIEHKTSYEHASTKAMPLPMDALPPDLGNTPVLVTKDADGLRLHELSDKTAINWEKKDITVAETPEAKAMSVGDILVGSAKTQVRSSGVAAPEPLNAAGARDSVPTAAAPPPPPAPPFRPPDQPPGAPPPGPGSIPDGEFHIAKNIESMARAEMKQPGVFDKVLRQLVGSHVRGPKDLAQLAAIQKGVQHLEASGIETVKALQRNFGKQMMTELDKDLMKLAKAPTEAERMKLSEDMGTKKYGQLWNKHKEKVHELLREKDLLDQTIAALGGVPDDLIQLREQGQIDAYVARSFMAYVLPPGRWAEIVKRDNALMAEGIAWLRQEHGLKATDHTMDGDLQAKLLDIIGANDPLAALKDPKYGIKSANSLKKREDLSPVLRRLLGENTSAGMLAIGQSLGSQRAIVANLGMWREIAQRPDWALPTLGANPELADAGWKRLPDNKRWYGDAAGMYVNPQIYDTMVTLPNTIENSKYLFQAMQSLTKGNEIALGGAGPWLNNTVANLFSCIKAGGIDPLGQPREAGKAIKRAVIAMLDYRANPSAAHGTAGLILEARRVGVEAPGFHGIEVDPLQKQLADNLLKQYAGGGDKSYFSILHSFADAYKAVRKPFGIAFDQNDRVFKLANWIALYEKFKTNPQRYLPEVGPQGVDEAAKRLAAYRVNRSFPAADKLGPAVDMVRKKSPGILARYWTPFAEDLRIASDIPAHMAEEPELALRVFKYTLAMGAIGGAGGMARRSSGIPDEEVEAVMAMQQKEGKRHGPDFMNVALPWRDSKGRPQLWDLTPHVPIMKFFEGTQDQGMFSTVLVNAGLQASSGGAGEDVVSGVAAQAGVPGMQDKAFLPPRPGEAGLLNMLNYTWTNLSLGPKAITKEYDILRRYGAFGGTPNTQEQLTGPQAVMRSLGPKIEPVTLPGAGEDDTASPTMYANIKALNAVLRQLEGQIPGIAQMPPDQAMNMLPEIARRLESDPKRYKDIRLQATVQQIKDVLARFQAQGDVVRRGQEAKKRPPSIFPEWAK